MKKIAAILLCLGVFFTACVSAAPTEDMDRIISPSDASVQESAPQDIPPEMPSDRQGSGRMGDGPRSGPEGKQPPSDGQIPQMEPVAAASDSGVTETETTGEPSVQDIPQEKSATTGEGQMPEDFSMPDNGEMQMPGMGGRMGRGGMGMNGMPGQFAEDMPAEEGQSSENASFSDFIQTYQTPIISVVLLIFAFVFVIFYKRKTF